MSLDERAAAYTAFLRDNRWGLPLADYELTATFGQSSSLWSSVHTGLDFAAPTGTPILSVARGTVAEAGWAGAYGERTVVVDADGTEFWYCHQESTSVSPGEDVAAGEVIGTVGATGNVTGPHLHLEVRPRGGAPVDPFVVMADRGASP
ncbi:peptidoglycan DD-metalloendopeptidase family protein [Nocardioides perillae]|uniref:Murein DD-endopeptidase MepM/ murein hydrolase activator NlpD n=1 Tax=Nocardioides perillae TaxID=1119534 RepID=A0A7Y9ULT3_9ACTN|nr:murein DD-endopeptidase MepM/ murein hydrolase activator NlpD [Nocardioides perillae]